MDASGLSAAFAAAASTARTAAASSGSRPSAARSAQPGWSSSSSAPEDVAAAASRSRSALSASHLRCSRASHCPSSIAWRFRRFFTRFAHLCPCVSGFVPFITDRAGGGGAGR